jgi:hypothetical protein
MKKLMLCAGATKREGWITLDGDPMNHPDILATIPPLPEQVLSEKWDEIEWIHGVGSIYPWEAEEALAQLRRAMDPAGVLILEQPNLLEAAAEILRDPLKAWWLFGDPQHRRKPMMNAWAYTPESLTDALKRAGFGSVRISGAQYHGASSRDFRAEARP